MKILRNPYQIFLGLNMELIKLIILLIAIGYAGDYAFEWQAEREYELQRQADLMELERRR